MDATWFYDLGFGVFPVSAKKVPLVHPQPSWQGYVCTREDAAKYPSYGIELGFSKVPRLDLLGVVDTDNEDDEKWVAAHLPTTPLVVYTARGTHRYYRLQNPVPKYIERDGHAIEFRNNGEYVVGPGSLHASGLVYTAAPWSEKWLDVPLFPGDFLFKDGSVTRERKFGERFEFPDVVHPNMRHDQLFRQLRALKLMDVMTKDEVYDQIVAFNRARCSPPLREDRVFKAWFERQWRKPDQEADPLEVLPL